MKILNNFFPRVVILGYLKCLYVEELGALHATWVIFVWNADPGSGCVL